MTNLNDDRTDDEKRVDSALEKAIVDAAEVYEISGGLKHPMLERFVVMGRLSGMREINGQMVEVSQYIKLLQRGGVGMDYDAMIGMLRRGEQELLKEYHEEDEV
jgi:hypothetical protein